MELLNPKFHHCIFSSQFRISNREITKCNIEPDTLKELSKRKITEDFCKYVIARKNITEKGCEDSTEFNLELVVLTKSELKEMIEMIKNKNA